MVCYTIAPDRAKDLANNRNCGNDSNGTSRLQGINLLQGASENKESRGNLELSSLCILGFSLNEWVNEFKLLKSCS